MRYTHYQLLCHARSEKKEIHQALMMTGIATTTEEIDGCIRKIDTGGDGTVSENEFIEFMAQQLLVAKKIRVELDMAFDSTRDGIGFRTLGRPTLIPDVHL